MWPTAILVVLGSIIGLQQLYTEVVQPRDYKAMSANAVSMNMLVYRSAVESYVATKAAGYTETATDNVVPDSSLSFPDWYVRNPVWTNKVIDGKVTVYATSRPAQVDISNALAKATNGSRYVGVVDTSTNTIVSPIHGYTGIQIPARLPSGVPVAHSKIK